ncbi:MAG: DUF4340 domain-containing protein [Acidobacteriaceae bacterium]|nr:DUF4340 domain-containing protein [Acidobacteriaceae bacterium]
MKSRNLLIAAVLLAALSGAVWWAKKHPEASSTGTATNSSPKLLDITDAQLQSIDLTKRNGDTIALQRQNGKWVITSPQQLPADQDAMTSMASALNPLTADSVVEDKATNMSTYGLSSPSVTVRVHEKNGKSDTLAFGDDVPAGSLVYARLNNGAKVYAVSSSAKTSFDKTMNDLRDKHLLTFNQNSVSRIELTSAKGTVEFGKNNQNEWQIVKPQPYRADNFEVEELLRKLSEAKMDLSGSGDDVKKAAADFAAGQQVSSVTVTDAGGTQTLQVRKNKDDYYAKSSVVSGVYKISADLGKSLEKTPEDFRNKKIFDFGFSDPTKIGIQQASGEKVLARSGTDWKLNGQTMDAGSVQSVIDKLRDLSATKFAVTGFTATSFTISVTSNDGKRSERVDFAKTPDGYIARRQNEPALYVLDAKPVNDILEAANGIKAAAPAKKK